MLRIIKGTDKSEKTVLLSQLVKKSIDSGRQVYILIPDQFSLLYDKKIYDILGPLDFNKVTIVGPDRLCKKLIESHGSKGKRFCDENSRLIMLHRACKAFAQSGDARYYKKSLSKAQFFKSIGETFSELRQSNVSSAELIAASETLEGTISDKLFDISSLYRLYEQELSEHGLLDSGSAVSVATEIIRDEKIFDGCDFYIDSFSSFSQDQLRMLSVIFSQVNDAAISITIGSGKNLTSNLTPFSVTIATASKLARLALDCGHEVSEIKSTENGFVSSGIRRISDCIFSSDLSKEEADGCVQIVRADDSYSQAEFVFAQICDLVRNAGYKFSDIAIISRSLEDSASLLDDMAARFDVPLFIDMHKNVSQSSPVLFINSVFDSIRSRTFSTKTLLSYIKSPLSDVELWEANLIEEYAFKWSIDGDMWLSDFTASDKPTEKLKASELEKVNSIRKRVVEPLVALKSASENSTASSVSLALNEFLRSVRISDKTFSEMLISSASEENALETTRVFKQIWTMFLSAITSVYEVLGDVEMTLSEYCELLSAMLSQMQVSSPPQKLDAVIAASAQHTRVSGIKVAFILDANDGSFPKTVKSQGLFTDREKAALEQKDISMEKRLETSIQSERFTCYSALTVASERLYICYPSANEKGEHLRPSPIISQIEAMFRGNICINAKDMPIEFFCANQKSAFYKYSELCSTDPHLAQTLRIALCLSSEEYTEKFASIDRILNRTEHAISADTAQKLFWQNPLSLSATKMDTYHRCPFSYFCKYGLKISPPSKIELNRLNEGSITHHCLETIMSTIENGVECYNSDFTSMSDDEIKNAVSVAADKYIEESMGGDFGKNASFASHLERLKESITKVVTNVRDELCNTDFVPEAFEFSLTDDTGRSIMPLFSSDGKEINLRGFIDRVDFLRIEDKCYVRIIDYKTGSKSFKYQDIYNGINQQMLIYLLAITSTVNALNKGEKLIPAGIIYMNAYENISLLSAKQLAEYEKSGKLQEKITDKKNKAYKRNGVVLNEIRVASNMDKNFTGRFSPISIKKGDKKQPYGSINPISENNALSIDELGRLCQFTKDTIITMADNLSDGKIEAMPKTSPTFDTCKYCDYSAVCGFANREDAVQITSDDEDTLFSIIREGAKGNG